jgi:dimethylglycine dehydrogenase
MRLEKGYRHWKADLITEFDPFESDLGRFVKMDKPTFPGKEALLAKEGKPMRRKFVTLVVDCQHAAAHPGDSIYADGKVVGTVTSAGYGYRVNKNIAMGFVNPEHAEESADLHVDIIGEQHAARVVAVPLLDPDNALLKS